ncbi:MAG: tetratricopeptide repeat protein [Armatimonadota bacterium]
MWSRTLVVSVLTAVGLAAAVAAQEAVSPAEEHYQEGLKLKKEGKVDQAIGALEKAVAADPEKAGPHWVLGWLYAKKAQKQQAIAEFEKYLKLAPDSPNAPEARKAIERLQGAVAAPAPAPPAAGARARPMPSPAAGPPSAAPTPAPAAEEEAPPGGGLPLPALIGVAVAVVVIVVTVVLVIKKRKSAAPPVTTPEAAPEEAARAEAPIQEAPAAAPATTVNLQFHLEGATPEQGSLAGVTASVDKATRQLSLFNPADNTTQVLPLDDIGDCRLDRDAGGPYLAIAMRDGQRNYWLRADEEALNALYADIAS